MNTFIFLVVGAAVGVAIGWFVRDSKGKSDINSAELKAQKIIKDSEAKEQDLMIRAKEKAVKILEEARREEKKALDEVKKERDEFVKVEKEFGSKLLDLDAERKKIESEIAAIDAKQKRIDELHIEEVKKLEEVAKLTEDKALERIMQLVETKHKESVISRMRKLDEQSQEEIDRKAKNILAVAVQRQAASHVQETTTSHIELPSDEMKGRIIGREGRNIKAIEQLTGCELIVDETPGMLTISGFSPIRRQIAKRALTKLIEDGRIHPGRVEEAVAEAKKELAVEMKRAGEDALYEMGISTAEIDPKLVQILGRMKFRTSFGQNALLHSLEVAKLSIAIGEQVGADMYVCRVGGLFHDIGKAVDHDLQGGHPELGYQILKKFGFPETIYYQSIGHHEDKPKTLEAVVIKAADAISGARPGARKDSFDLYVKRLEQLESTVKEFPGIDKVYAIQAGREVRVFVNPAEIDDLAAEKLARDIAAKLEAELKYPGEIRVTLIREKRVTEYAR